VLHRASIYRFFLDAASVAERAGDHIRAVTARRTLRDATADDPRQIATPSFILFPATTIIAHPDFVSVITVAPLAPDRTDVHHMMLVPAARASEAEHWDKSWQLIEETVFQREDLWVCEQVQRGLADGRTDELVFGALENAVEWFHQSIDSRCG
jgi:phenylpropionate dioxygenase-like ring-hydroxylating dioxygenase large terminal subunit